jgi:serine/threonine-protein kinase
VTVAATLLAGRYCLDEEIGAGGFCEVWRAADTVLTRPVAVKLLHAGYAHEPGVRARFRAEARHAAALSHQNIARVYDYGEPVGGPSYLVMELIRGPSLAGVLAGGPLGAARTLDIVAQVAAGLQAAHRAGLVHRDIKPANILFTPAGTARITDFGIAYAAGSAPLTATGTVLGTPGYLAPERIAGARAGPASDLYALGIMAYECLVGARPFAGTALEVAIAHRERPLPPLPAGLPTEVADFVMVLTAKDPAWRPGNAGQVADQARWLRDHLVPVATGARSVPVGAPPTTTDATESHARGAVRSRTGNGRSRPRARGAVLGQTGNGRSRPRALAAAALVALAALTCLIVLTVTGVASAAHPPAGRPQAAPSATRSPSTASPVAAQPAGQQPSLAPNARVGAVAAVVHRAVRHPTPQPGPRHKQRPGPGEGNAPGHKHRPGPGKGNAPGHKHRPRPGNSPATVVVGAGSVPDAR